MRKISPPPAFDLRTVQPVVSRYTDRAIAVHTFKTAARKKKPLSQSYPQEVKWEGRRENKHQVDVAIRLEEKEDTERNETSCQKIKEQKPLFCDQAPEMEGNPRVRPGY